MARIAVSVMPFAGHVTPVLAVAAELVRRGHDVVAYTGAKYAPRFTDVGASWQPWQQAPDFDDADLAATFPQVGDGKGDRAGRANGEHVILRTGVGQTRDLVALHGRNRFDAVVTDQMSVGGALAAEKLRLPLATVAVIPLALTSRHLPPPGMRLRPVRTASGRARDAALRAVAGAGVRRLLDPIITDVRSQVGLDRAAVSGLDGLFSTQLVLAQGVPGFDYPRRDLPPHVHYVGRLAPEPAAADADLPSWWTDVSRARAEGRPVVHVTQGTLHVDPADLIRPSMTALADREALVVVTTGRDAARSLGALPSNVRAAPFIPYDLLLPHVDVMVSNGGWSSVLAAVAAGVPLVVAGADLDKPEVARRVGWSGVGVDLRTGRPRPGRVRAAVDRVLADPGVRQTAQRLSEEFDAAGGARKAGDLIEGMPTPSRP
jgi:UDP:flavonoid glycosyltransferase YjiC (YdhE family)